jgi:hypothetical protein
MVGLCGQVELFLKYNMLLFENEDVNDLINARVVLVTRRFGTAALLPC